jgi:hypothetical protein
MSPNPTGWRSFFQLGYVSLEFLLLNVENLPERP